MKSLDGGQGEYNMITQSLKESPPEQLTLLGQEEFLGWEPRVSYAGGFKKTIAWYFANRDERRVKTDLYRLLMEH